MFNASPEFNNTSIFIHSIPDVLQCKEVVNEFIYALLAPMLFLPSQEPLVYHKKQTEQSNISLLKTKNRDNFSFSYFLFLFSSVLLLDFRIILLITNLITKENIIKNRPASKNKIRSYFMVSTP